MLHDPVEKPQHYNMGKIQVLDFILDQKMGYLAGNVTKYLCRYRFKGEPVQVLRPSTIQEWRCYGEILRRVDEAKQWAIGDWLADGKRHYGDGLYKKAAELLDIPQRSLEELKQISGRFKITERSVNLTWSHHKEISSIKQIEEDKKGKLKLSDEPDKEKMQWFLAKSEKDNWSVRFLREQIQNIRDRGLK